MGLCYNIAFVFLYEKIYPETIEIEAIIQIVSIEENATKYIGKIIDSDIKYSKNTKLIIYTNNSEELTSGNIIKIKGIFEKADKARNYKGFNYRNYLKTRKIYGIINCEKISIIDNKNDFITVIEQVRYEISNKILNLYNENKYTEFLKGILIGRTEGIDEKIKNNFRDSSISHILAISGLHVSYVILGIQFILNKLVKSKRKQNIIQIIFLIIFSFLTGLSASCIRSCIMIMMKLIASISYRKNNIYISLIISFFIIIMINPFNIYNIGMWLSFAGTVGIIIFSNFFSRIAEIKLKNKITFYISKIIFVSISAQIFIFPIMIYCFNTISISFFIPNFFISFLISPILCLGYISVILSYLKFPFINILVKIEKILISILLGIAEICSKIPLSKIYIITPSIIFIVLYYIGIILIVYLFKKRKFYYLKIIISFKFSYGIVKNFIKRIKLEKILLVIIISLFFMNIPSPYLKINFVDVGQGDCTVIQTPKRKNIIIDGGEGNTDKYDYGENIVLPYLLDRKIKRVDYLIISHCDSDHIGGVFAVLKNLEVDRVLIGIQPEESQQFDDLMKIVKDKKIKITFLQAGDKMKIEDNLEIKVIWPDKNNIIQENKLNNNSLVFKLMYKNFSILFTGDIEEIAEKAICDIYLDENLLKSTILKIAHHGSKTSSTQEFVELVNPKICFIGVGKNNNFGHPSDEVIKRLEKYRSKNI